MSDRLDLQLLDRFLTGAASEAEAARVRRWLADHPADSRVASPADLAAATRAGLAAGEQAWDVDSAWQRLQPRLEGEPPQGGPAPVPVLRLVPSAPVRRWRRLVLAGAGLAAAAAAVLVWRGGFAPAPRSGGAPMAELATVAGQRATLRLPDGTTVRLDAGSRVRYPARPAPGAARELELEGQAYFTVTHDPARPFTVRAGGALLEDLGTEFGVTAYPGAAGLRVVVARGRVSVRPRPASRWTRSTERELGAGEMARVDSLGRIAVSTVDVRPWLAWTQGVLAFDARPLAEVVPELGRWYGVEIRIADPALAARPVTAEFRDEPLERVLDAIAMALTAHWERTGTIVTLRPGARP